MFRKTLVATALSGALAISGFATPAAAEPGGQDYARVLLGIVTLGVLADAIDNNNRSNRVETRRDNNRYDRDFRDHRRGGWNLLPSRCEYTVRGRNGRTNVFGESCLQQEGVRVNRLPQQCEFRIRTDRGRRTVYASECLENHGFTTEAHWRDRRR